MTVLIFVKTYLQTNLDKVCHTGLYILSVIMFFKYYLSGILANHGASSVVAHPSEHVDRAEVGRSQDQPTAPSPVERVHRRNRTASGNI